MNSARCGGGVTRRLGLLILVCGGVVGAATAGCDIKTDKPPAGGVGGSGAASAGRSPAPLRGAVQAEELKAVMEGVLRRAAGGDAAGAGRVLVEMVPTAEQLVAALAPGTDPGVAARIAAMHEELRRRPPTRIAGEGATRVNVWAATTEELKAYERDSVAWKEFTGGAKSLAQAGVLRPGMTWYEVEFVRPGEDVGTKYHLFYHDGQGWRMLGSAWRAMREPAPPSGPQEKK